MALSKITRLHINGSSVALIVPKNICRLLDMKRGDTVVVYTDGKKTVSFRKMSEDYYKKVLAL